MIFSDAIKTILAEKISLYVSPLLINPACIAGVLPPTSESQRSVRPEEVVIAAEQVDVILERLLPTSMTDRSATKIGRTLSDGEIQPFDERGV